MNELFAMDPAVGSRPADLRRIVAYFGPYAGRYLANFPEDWEKRVFRESANLTEIEAERIKTILRRMREQSCLVTRKNLQWTDEINWLDNARLLISEPSPKLIGLIAEISSPPRVYSFEEVDLPPTAEERIAAIPDEFLRAAKILLSISHDIALIDPYLDPRRSDRHSVLAKFFEQIPKVAGRVVSIWVRHSAMCQTSNSDDARSEIEACLRKLIGAPSPPSGFKVRFFMIDDAASKMKLHARYLLTNKGGMRFDQGFQQLFNGRRVDVGPIQPSVHDELLTIFHHGKHDMDIVQKISLDY